MRQDEYEIEPDTLLEETPDRKARHDFDNESGKNQKKKGQAAVSRQSIAYRPDDSYWVQRVKSIEHDSS